MVKIKSSKSYRIGAALVAVLLIVAACGGDDTSDTTAAAPSATTEAPAETTTTAAPATDETPATTAAPATDETPATTAAPAADDEPVSLSVTDGSGREITLDAPAERVLCVQDNCTDLTSDLGIVPVAMHRGDGWGSAAAYYGDGAGAIPVLGDRMSVEEVAQYSPDLIIGRVGEEEVRDALEVVAPVYLVDIGGVDTLKEGWVDVGLLTGREAEAAAAIARFDANVGALSASLPAGAVDTRVAVGFGDTNWMIWDSSSFCRFLHSEGAGTCVFPDQGVSEYGSPDSEFSWEFILEADPEVWVMITWPGSARKDTVAAEVWLQTTAHREGRVCEEDSAGSFGHGLLMLQWAYQCYLNAGWPDTYNHPGDLSVWLPGTAAAFNTEEPVSLSVTDGSGREITLDAPAERVLCVQDNCTDLTSDLGIVPVAMHRGDGWGSAAAYYGDGAGAIPVLGDRMSVEEVAQYSPDLIIGRVGEEEVRDALEVVAPVYLVDIGGVDTLKEGWVDVGLLTGREAEAAAAIARFDANVGALSASLPAGAVDTRVAVGFGDTNWMIWDSSSFCRFLHSEGAGTCVFPDQGVSEYGSPDSEFSWEFILEADPEVWVMITWPGSARKDTVAAEVWLQTTAHREGRVCEEDSAGSFGHGLLMLQWAYQCYLNAGWPDTYNHPGDLSVWQPAT